MYMYAPHPFIKIISTETNMWWFVKKKEKFNLFWQREVSIFCFKVQTISFHINAFLLLNLNIHGDWFEQSVKMFFFPENFTINMICCALHNERLFLESYITVNIILHSNSGSTGYKKKRIRDFCYHWNKKTLREVLGINAMRSRDTQTVG